jgi:hypothetical protein
LLAAKTPSAPAQPAEIQLAAAQPNTAPARKQSSAAQEISALQDVMDGDRPETEKLGIALATLDYPDKKVRAAALENVKDLDDRDAIPRLQALAAQTDDPDEQAALLEVADYLNLPSASEVFAAHSPPTRLVPKNSTIHPLPRAPRNPNNAQTAPFGNATAP